MEFVLKFLLVILSIIVHNHYVSSDGLRDYGEACSLRSQLANFIRQNDSPEGCISAKGLICISHKCVCDPTSVYENVTPEKDSSSDGNDGSGFRASAMSFFKKIVGGTSSTTTTTTASPAAASAPSISGGRCVGRSGSPCLTANATCVQHAECQGSPKLCRCQGIYSSNTEGMCSKRATVANQAIKGITGFIGK